jgi:YggT family protein
MVSVAKRVYPCTMVIMVINPVTGLLLTVIQLYEYVLITWVVLSVLISFGIINKNQPVVQRINFALFRLTNPLLRPIRKHMPDLGGFDISPIILILALEFIANTLIYYSR